jgi:hemolysin activation/secretion protein
MISKSSRKSFLVFAGLVSFLSLPAAEPAGSQKIDPIAPSGTTLRNDPFGQSVRPAPKPIKKDEGWLIAGLVGGSKSSDRLDGYVEIPISDIRFVKRCEGPKDGQPLSAEHDQALLAAAYDFLRLTPPLRTPASVKLAQLENLAQHLAVRYKELTGIAMPVFLIGEQDVTDGVLKFDVVEAVLEDVEFPGDGKSLDAKSAGAKSAALSLVSGMRGKVMQQEEVERTILLLQEITGESYSIQYGTGKEAYGVRMRVTPRDATAAGSLLGSVRVDNQGSPSLGQTQFSTQLNWRPDWLFGDQLTANYVTSERSSSLAAYALSYESALGSQGWRGGLRLSKVNYEVGGALSAAGANGLSETAGLYASYPILRSFSQRLDATFGLAHSSLQDRTTGTSNPRSNDSLTAEIRGATSKPSYSQNWSVSAAFSNLKHDTAAQVSADVLGVRGKSLTLNAEYRRVDWLTSELDLTYGVRAQWTSSNLDGFQKMSLGGMNGIRAFAPSEVSADNALIGRIELGYTIRSASYANRLSAFYDHGEAEVSKSPLTSVDNRLTLAGAGLQWQFSSDIGLGARVFVAVPTGNSSRTVSSVDKKTNRVGFELNYAF